MQDALKKYFGFENFRPLQREIIEAVLAKNDVFALMPTGAGKSLCFQLPAVLLPGITLVISPLIALMKDQVDALNASGIPATFLNSSLDAHERQRRVEGLRNGKYKLLYVAPERFPVPGFIDFLSRLNVSLCVVDEAHCISEWGHDFRADYRNLHLLRDRFSSAPIMAVTATATDRVQTDILEQLHLRSDTKLFRASFDRKNLTYQVWPKRAAMAQLTGYLERRKGESGIVYCLSRETTERVAQSLKAHGHNALPYHAGMEKEQRTHTQELFDRDKVDIICATIAFGMGIDKPNIRFVFHYDIPKSIPSYYQETGRAGRDSLPSDCITFYNNGDRQKYLKFFDEKPPEERLRAIEELDRLVDLMETRECRRKALLRYFGEEYSKNNCGTCDNCLSTQNVESFDGTRLAQMFLSCIVRVGQNFGASHIIDILRGSERGKVLDFSHHKLPTHGVGKDYQRQEWQHYANEFRRQGLIIQDHSHFGVIKITPKGWNVLKNGTIVTLNRPWKEESIASEAFELAEVNRKLFEELRAFRRASAEQNNVPPFVIFNDYTLREIAARVPNDAQEFLAISGVNESKWRQFGPDFLRLVRNFKTSNPTIKRQESVSKPISRELKGGDSAFETLIYFRKGHSPQKIAELRSLAISTINGHIASLIQSRHITSLDRLVDPSRIPMIRAAFTQLGYGTTLTEVRQHLGDEYSFEEIKFVRAMDESG